MSAPLVAVACLKLVELRAGVDALTGAVLADPASAGPSPADEAALEWALRLGEAAGCEVVALSAGGSACDPMLRRALAAGAQRAVRVALQTDAPSALVAAALAGAIRSFTDVGRASAGQGGSDDDARSDLVVCCGDASVDRGSGSVPAFLAAELGAAQALGLVEVTIPPLATGQGDGSWGLEVLRRLEGGRRERLRLAPPCVLSVEAATARLRRAPLGRLIDVGRAGVQVIGGTASGGSAARGTEVVGVAPFRPRTRVVPPPPVGLGASERIALLTGTGREPTAARTLVVGPEEAADELLAALASWGELPDGLTGVLGGGEEGPASAGTRSAGRTTRDETELP